MAVFAMTCAERLRDQGIEANKNAFTKKGENDEQARRDADGADGFGAVGESADHHGIDDDHVLRSSRFRQG